jgi:hypothetical protein
MIACCGAIRLPQPEWISPYLQSLDPSVQKLAPDEYLCSPPLTYKRGNVIRRFPLHLGPGPHYNAAKPIPPDRPIRRLPNGNRLIKDGPWWSYIEQSHSMCAGCPFATLTIFSLTSGGDLIEALKMGARVGENGVFDYNIEMSADWRTVTQFVYNGIDEWTAQKFCLTGDKYESCGEVRPSPPPKNGLLKGIQ